ncbi:MAG: hypothetical protein KBT87_12325 [Gammaproteobacteria bacterium]|nr:hypothetical protein [Gammaproteobacteria bacterium]MBQ0775453.1 hypothetical protein [Gammaproteobacteria bacterium]
MKKLLLILPLISYSSVALAEFPIGKVGVRVSPKVDIDIDGAPKDGDGNAMGLYGEFGSTSLFGYADAQRSDLDILNVSIDLDETRFGLGARTSNETGSAEVRVERYEVDLDIGNASISDDGSAVHVGGALNIGAKAAVFADFGFISMSDLDGDEFQVGVRGNISDSAEIYGAYRTLTLEDDFNDGIELSELRLGVNLLF